MRTVYLASASSTSRPDRAKHSRLRGVHGAMRSILAFPLVRIVLIAIVFAIPLTIVMLIPHGLHSDWVGIAIAWFLAAALLLSIALVERVTTGRGLAQIGFAPEHAMRDLVLGLIAGAVLFTVVVLELALTGHYRASAVAITPDLAIAVLLLLPGAAIEEMLFRGVLFRLVEEWAGSWVGIIVSAVLFGAAHAANHGATWISTVAIALEAGVLLAAAYIVTRTLWFPIGLHFGWNFFEGSVYGTQLSGGHLGGSMLAGHVSGPAWLTGGAFGPEAGVPAIVTCVIAAAILLAYATSHGKIRPMRSRA
jgi:membrane protease YdiL (CAAX protease family)